jgi:ketosteroid isomerase-like protein
MSAEQNTRIVRDYLAGRGPELLAEDATLHDWTQPEPIRGREAIEAALHHYYEEAFSGASAEYRNWIANDDCVVLEFTFRGVNTGFLRGRSPTGKSVEVPMCAIYDVQDGIIRRFRLYYDSAQMP